MDFSRYGRTLLYLVTAIPLGAVGGALLLAGWIVVGVLSITPLVVPALVAYRAAVGGLARVEGALANALLGTALAPRASSSGPRGFWRRAGNILQDTAFWTQQAFFLLRFVLGGALAILQLSLIGGGLAYLTLPIWYRWGSQNYGSWHVDTLGRAFIFVPAGLLALGIALLLMRPLESLSRSLAVGLLGGGGPAYADPSSPRARARRRRALAVHAGVSAAIGLVTVVIWAATTPGDYFWPAWVLLPLAGALAVHAWTDLALVRRWRGVVLHAGYSAILFAQLVVVWALAGGGYFWPAWVALALGIALGIHWAIDRHYGGQAKRIEQLESTRAGAIDQQGADLRRIERDLHDGAQAQLVALGMSIGLAEQKLADDPEAARELLGEARRNAREALEELRGLARGIHPPVLTDRGLAAAIVALADRTPLVVRVDVALDERPPETVETAAYFVVAESLANAGKHANAANVDITVWRVDGRLVVEVADDGSGGADAAGNGLRGLERRVEALDGTLDVESPVGGGTIVRAVMPCAS
jgi:signal transduction histidine kinase